MKVGVFFCLKEGISSEQCSMCLKKVCPQCSAVVSVRKLHCDCGQVLPYKREVEVLHDGQDTICADTVSKRAKRKHEI